GGMKRKGDAKRMYALTGINNSTPLFRLHGGDLNSWFVVTGSGNPPPSSSGSSSFSIHQTGSDALGPFTLDETFVESYQFDLNSETWAFTLDETVLVSNFRLERPLANGNGSVYSGSDNLTLHLGGQVTGETFTVSSLTLDENGAETFSVDQSTGTATNGMTLHVGGSDTFT